MAANDQYMPGQAPFGMAGVASTGFPGSPSPDTAAATHGAVVGNPVVSTNLASSQVPENRPTLAVTAGDTCSNSDDLAVHVNVLTPSYSDSTGIGRGRASHQIGGAS